LHVENEPSTETEANKIDAANKDYLFYIADPSITNEIKKMEIYSPGTGTQERQQLHADYEKLFSELRRVYGIRHLTSKKEERQNNPEVELNESQFIALERDKKRERLRSIKDFESKGCKGKQLQELEEPEKPIPESQGEDPK
jgi:Ser-tRNA(Ala) deacylase AlaX